MKKTISFILIILLLVCNINVNSYAMQFPDHNFNYDSLESYWKLFQDVGFIVSYPAYSTGRTLGSILKKYLNSVEAGSGDNITSDQDAGNWARNNISVNGDGNIVLNSDAKAFINYSINDYINSTGMYYVYSNNINNYANSFGTADLFNECKSKLNEYKSTNKLVVFYRIQAEGLCEMYVFPANSGLVFNSDKTNNYYVQPYNKSSWNWAGYEKWEFNTSTKKFDKNYRSYNAGQYTNPFYVSKLSTGSLYNTYDPTLFSVDGVNAYIMYMTLDGLRAESVGQAPYYINNSVYTSYKNSSGDYTVTIDNSNHATYGDVQTYIDNHHTENDEYPTPTQIEIYIEQVPAPTPTPTPTPEPTITPDNPSGGGGTVSGNTNNGGNASASATANNSGVNVTVNNNHNINLNVPGLSGNGIGSGTVSGNGNGSGGIFDWISDIGGVIGEFIKNVGSLIADVVKGITETITTILADIPNIISVLVEFVYGGLPDELKAIVTLGITTVIFVGVIKMMRK